MDGKSPASARNFLEFSWLLKLRWAQFVGQLVTILVVILFFDLPLPVGILMAILGAAAGSNLVWQRWLRGNPVVDQWHLAVVMAVDVASLTVILFFAGGISNPFSFLYLVQIALSALLLSPRWTVMLTVLSLGALGMVAAMDIEPLPFVSEGLNQVGMWSALAVASCFIGYFLHRVKTALAQREQELQKARDLTARRERLGALSTLAAGAAHELSTPLATIALVAGELERMLSDAGAIEDIRLIKGEVARCKKILDQMAGGAGDSVGEGVVELSIHEIVADATDGIRLSPEVVVRYADKKSEALQFRLPRGAIAQAMRAILTNAQDASMGATEVELHISSTRRGAQLRVVDKGVGMSDSVVARLGEPFFTTKEPGKGTGLGMFLTRTIIDSVGGRLQFDSSPGDGTTVTVLLPEKMG